MKPSQYRPSGPNLTAVGGPNQNARINDPVAHIDDLNTLSFLDYLREIVIRGRKQVFFSTADIRLAALFQRKFEFMGSNRFKRISLPLLN